MQGKIFLVINKLKGKLLKMGESQHVRLEKSGVDEVENSDDDDKRWDDK